LPLDPLIGVWSVLRSPALAAGLVLAVTLGAIGLRMGASDEPQTIAQAIGVPPEFLDAGPGR
jgi:hypothetical protein